MKCSPVVLILLSGVPAVMAQGCWGLEHRGSPEVAASDIELDAGPSVDARQCPPGAKLAHEADDAGSFDASETDGPTAALGIYDALRRGGGCIEVGIERRGQRTSLDYEIH